MAEQAAVRPLADAAGQETIPPRGDPVDRHPQAVPAQRARVPAVPPRALREEQVDEAGLMRGYFMLRRACYTLMP